MELKELVARALFNDKFRLRNWEHSKPYLQQALLKRAEEALRRSGVENVQVNSKVELTENVNRTN